MKELVKQATEKGFELSDDADWDYLYLCELQKWLIDEKKIIVSAKPVDSWDSWSFKILAEDIHCPFFEVKCEYKEFTNKSDALEAGLKEALTLINQ